MQAYEATIATGGKAALQAAEQFFTAQGAVHQTLRRITSDLNELGVDYAIAGGMALVAHGYNRTTNGIDLLVAPEGLEKIHEHLSGLGYTPPFTGSKNLRNTKTGVRLEFILTGGFPGDGKPKPVAFPDPATVATEIDGVRYVQLNTLIELKLASGMTNPGRLRDLADVQELIRVLKLDTTLADQLSLFVKDKYLELVESVGPDNE